MLWKDPKVVEAVVWCVLVAMCCVLSVCCSVAVCCAVCCSVRCCCVVVVGAEGRAGVGGCSSLLPRDVATVGDRQQERKNNKKRGGKERERESYTVLLER